VLAQFNRIEVIYIMFIS